MIIVCICGKKKFEVNSDLIPSTGRTIQCGSCDKVWFFNPNKENLYIEEDSEPKISETINIEEKNEVSQNISLWLEKISKLNEDYNLIIRPHPKNLIIDRDLKEKIKTNNFFIDEKADRKLAELYIFSDLILLDYGSSVLSSIY